MHTLRPLLATIASSILALSAGCATDSDSDDGDGIDDDFLGDGKTDTGGTAVEGSPEALAILGVVKGKLVGELVFIGLELKASEAITAYADGPDKSYGTSDDRTIDSLATLDAIEYVGPRAFNTLFTYVTSQGLVRRLDCSNDSGVNFALFMWAPVWHLNDFGAIDTNYRHGRPTGTGPRLFPMRTFGDTGTVSVNENTHDIYVSKHVTESRPSGTYQASFEFLVKAKPPTSDESFPGKIDVTDTTQGDFEIANVAQGVEINCRWGRW